MTTFTASYTGILSPDVVVTAQRDVESGAPFFTAEITILGASPSRNTTAEERVAGIISLAGPIEVQAYGYRELIDIAKRATSTAVFTTPDSTLTTVPLILTEMLVARSVRAALRKIAAQDKANTLGIDI